MQRWQVRAAAGAGTPWNVTFALSCFRGSRAFRERPGRGRRAPSLLGATSLGRVSFHLLFLSVSAVLIVAGKRFHKDRDPDLSGQSISDG